MVNSRTPRKPVPVKVFLALLVIVLGFPSAASSQFVPGDVIVKFNGVVADTGPITVVANSFGIFTINQQGYGPIVGTNPLAGAQVYSVTNSAPPQGFIDIWGTGLGAVAFPDEGPTIPSNLGYEVEVYLGDKQIPVEYAGRSGCCSSIDLIRVKVPADLVGCFMPITVIVEGITSNYGTISVDPDGGDCSPNDLFGDLVLTTVSPRTNQRMGAV